MKKSYLLVLLGLVVCMTACGKKDEAVETQATSAVETSAVEETTNSYASGIQNGEAISEFESSATNGVTYYDKDGNEIAVQYDEQGNPVGDYYDKSGMKVTVPTKPQESSSQQGSGLSAPKQQVVTVIPDGASEEEIERLKESAAQEYGVNPEDVETMEGAKEYDKESGKEVLESTDKSAVRDKLISDGQQTNIRDSVFGQNVKLSEQADMVREALGLPDSVGSKVVNEDSGETQMDIWVSNGFYSNIHYHNQFVDTNKWSDYDEDTKVGIVLMYKLGFYTLDDLIGIGSSEAEIERITSTYLE